MRKQKLSGEYAPKEGIISTEGVSDSKGLFTNTGTEEIEKWALFISACGGIGFILKEEAQNLNMGPLGETRTIHNMPDADGKVIDSIDAYKYEVYG